MEVFSRYIVTCGIFVIIDGHGRLCPTIRLYQHLAVLRQHKLITVLDPVGVVFLVYKGSGVVHLTLEVIGIVIALVFVIVADTVLNTDIEPAVVLVGTIDITDITTTKDVTILTCLFLRCTYRTTMNVYMCLSKDITIGIECTTLTQVVISSTTTEDITVYVALIERYVRFTSLIDALQGTNAVVLTGSNDDTSSNGSYLTTTEEGVSYVTAIHLDVADIHTTIVNITTTKDTSTIIETIRTVARPRLVVQFLLIIVRTYLNIIEIGICGGYIVEMTITDKAIVQCDISCTEYSTTLTTAIGITLDGRNTIDEAVTVFLTDDNVSFTKDIACCCSINSSCVIAYTALPTTAIDVTCCTALDIGIGRSDKWLVEVISSYVVFVVYRTYGSCGVEVLCHFTTKKSNVGCSVDITSIGSISITQATTIGVCATETTVIHITADISALVDDHVGIVFLTVSGYCQDIVKTCVGIALTKRKLNRLWCLWLWSCGLLICCQSLPFCVFCIVSSSSCSVSLGCPCIHRLFVHHAT